MSYTFDDPEDDVTSVHAMNCWRDFLRFAIAESKRSGVPITEFDIAEEMLEAPTKSVSWFAFRFAKYCIVDRPSYGGPSDVISIECRWHNPAGSFPGPSWLSLDKAKVLRVWFNQTVYPLSQGCRKTATYILLHEIAHVLRNWMGISSGRLLGDYLNESTFEEERTAWWWAMEIVKANMGAHAFYSRQNSSFDSTGLLLFAS